MTSPHPVGGLFRIAGLWLQRTASAAVVSVLLSTSHAQESAESPSLVAIEEEVISLDDLVVTDSKSRKTILPVRPVRALYGFESTILDAPRSVSQINPEQFEYDVIASYSDFIRYSPAVNQATGQLDNYGSPSIRGALADVYQNGVRMLVRQSNNRPFTLNAYEGADIIAGPAPVIYGPSARTAGYVNYLTKKPHFDAPQTTVNLNIGRWYVGDSATAPRVNWQVDHGAPILPGRLAYRVSYQGEDSEAWYDNVSTRYHDVYGTLGWMPTHDLAVDWNFEYGNFDWTPNNGQNRVTSELIRDGTYLAGPATPIIQVGTGAGSYYSPVLNAQGEVTSWIRRTRVVNADGSNRFNAGASTTDPTSNSTAGAGTIVGYVLDPALVRPTRVDGSRTLNSSENASTTEAFNTQLRVKKQFSPGLSLLNNTIYQYYLTDNPNNGGVYNWIRSHTFENRTEAVVRLDYEVAGRSVRHFSNTGFSYRFEEVRNYKDRQRSGYEPTGNAWDLTADPSTFTRNAFFGATVYPFEGNINTPVLTRFGYLKGFWTYLTVPESPSNASTAGGSQTGTPAGSLSTASNHTYVDSASLYTQHSFHLGDRWIWDVGARGTLVDAHIKNPLATSHVPGNDSITDDHRELVPTWGSSLSFKPASWITTYATWQHVQATNGMTSGTVTWKTVGFGADAVPDQLDPADFNSLSELYEAGVKADFIPGKLVGSLAAYRQTRDLTLSLPSDATEPVQARGLYKGLEVSLRYQPTAAFHLGINYTSLDASYVNQPFSDAAPLVADNATNIYSSTTSVLRDYRIANLPRHNVAAYGAYQWVSGLGVKFDVWARDSAPVNASGSITIPAEYQINLGFFYNRENYRVSVDLQNVTGERNHAGGGMVLEPFNASLRLTYKL